MLGNVAEWVEDCYESAPKDGSAVTTGDCSFRVVRGGSWISLPRYLRAASRDGSSQVIRSNGTLGFRVVRTVIP
jgi:formylglycine-generating enzyme required for sulfatase activity